MNYNDMIGTPFQEHGNNCYDVVREVHLRHGINMPETNISVCACKEISNKEINDHKKKCWQKLKQPEIPCIVEIQSVHPDYANHIAVYIGKGKMLHVSFKKNVCIEKTENWKHKIIGYYKYVGYTD